MRTKLFAALLTALLLVAGCAPTVTGDADANPFTTFDSDGDGFVNESEYSVGVTNYTTTAGFSDIDANDDGFIDDDEFGPFQDDFEPFDD